MCSSVASLTLPAASTSRKLLNAATRKTPIHLSRTRPLPMTTHRSSCVAQAALTLFFALLAQSSSQAQTAEPQQTERKEAPAQTTSSATDSQKSNTLRQAVREKKVLTEDDLHPRPRRKYPQDVEPLEFNPICGPACEQRVRDQIASDDSSELEFRNKFAVAMQLIDDDHKWGNAVVEAVHAADAYCDLERN